MTFKANTNNYIFEHYEKLKPARVVATSSAHGGILLSPTGLGRKPLYVIRVKPKSKDK